ncbi:hypothetical protein E2C01_061597 [Portunus trituberculatus]|uniref:Uncharacterized protein n=1 Tax=Portunus trituberculatus TaxID=210409 RepID=A0A5B7H8K9_PORTR|nr:hypothetical protein [Portunus trituberculatus]
MLQGDPFGQGDLAVADPMAKVDLSKAPTVSLWRSLLGHLASLERLVPGAWVRSRSLKKTLEGNVGPSLMAGSSFTAVSGRPLLVDGSGSTTQGSSLCDGTSGTVCFLTCTFMVGVLIYGILLSRGFMLGRRNAVADVLSREYVGSEWNLHPIVCRQVFQVWGAPQVDLFATALNHQLPLYVSTP